MDRKLIQKYIPMTETAYYILLSLSSEIHGYGIKGHVEDLTEGRIKLGAGTIYGTLAKMETDGLIKPVGEYDRRRTYIRTEAGTALIRMEVRRLREMTGHAEREGIQS